MDKKLLLQGLLGNMGAWLIDKWGGLLAAIVLLATLMILDHISGMLAAKKEALEHPRSKKYGWNAKKSMIGVYKKCGYMLIILVAVSTDCILSGFTNTIKINQSFNSLLSILVTIWLIINESLSILENSRRMGAKLPNFLRRILVNLQKNMEKNVK